MSAPLDKMLLPPGSAAAPSALSGRAATFAFVGDLWDQVERFRATARGLDAFDLELLAKLGADLEAIAMLALLKAEADGRARFGPLPPPVNDR